MSCFMVCFCVSYDLSGMVSEFIFVAKVSVTVSPRGAFDKLISSSRDCLGWVQAPA